MSLYHTWEFKSLIGGIENSVNSTPMRSMKGGWGGEGISILGALRVSSNPRSSKRMFESYRALRVSSNPRSSKK